MRVEHRSRFAELSRAWLLCLAAVLPISRSSCPSSSVVTDHVYGNPTYGCCHYATLVKLFCNPTGPTAEDTTQGTSQCTELSAAAPSVDLQWTQDTWQACEAKCLAEPACKLWSLRSSQRGIGNKWLPAVCTLITEDLQCSSAWCKSPGSFWGARNCSAASLVEASEASDAGGANVSSAPPMCQAPIARPPVRGSLVGSTFELESGCRHRLWSQAAITECHHGAWVVIVGGSNAILMAIQMANMIAPGTFHPTSTKARTFDMTINDAVFENGAAIYKTNKKVIPDSTYEWSSRKGELAEVLARAPSYGAKRTRVTIFVGQYWPNVETALDVVNENVNWKGARDAQLVTVTTQISQWYLVCGPYRAPYCNRRHMMSMSESAILGLYRTEMEAVIERMKNYCAPGSPAGKLGCTISSNAYDPGQVSRVNGINKIISSVMEEHETTLLRFVDMFLLGEGAPTESVAAHSTPMLIHTYWQVVFGTVCTLAGVQHMTEPYPRFVGDTCFAHQTPGSMSTCPAYTSQCGFRCDRWECMHGPLCLVEGSNVSSSEEAETCVSRRKVKTAFLGGEPAAGSGSGGDDDCNRVWCDDAWKVILPILGVLGVLGAIAANLYDAGFTSKAPPPKEVVTGTVVGAQQTVVISVGEKADDPGNNAGADPEKQTPATDGGTAKVTDEEGPKPKKKDDRFPLGLARFLASLHIVAGHMYQQGSIKDVYFYGWGFSWVPWFFMLSGFVLFSANNKRSTDENPLEYVRRRSVTIWPLYAVSLIPMLILSKCVYSSQGSPGGGYLFAQAILVQSWVPWLTENVLQLHCWFLSCMVLYWLAFKPLYKCISSRGMGATCGLLLAIFIFPWIIAVIVPAAAGDVEWYKEHKMYSTDTFEDIAVVFLKFHPLSYFHVFLSGMLLAHLRLCLGKLTSISSLRIPMEMLVPFCYVVLVVLFAVESIKPWGFKLSARLSILLPLQAGILLGFAGIPNLPMLLVSWLALKVEFLADYSYAVYIFQFFCHKLWPTYDVGIGYFIFLIGTACAAVHLVQRPVQTLWKKLPPLACLAIPIVLGLILLGLSFIPDKEKPGSRAAGSEVPALAAEAQFSDGRSDIRLDLTFDLSPEEALINPTTVMLGNSMVVAARVHSRHWSQEVGTYQGEDVTIVNEIWHSDIVFGLATVTTNPPALRSISLSRWTGLRNATGQKWKELCYKEKYLPENKTLVRKVLTGPEDPRLIAYGGGVALSFNSVPPLGTHGCQPGGAVSQMYLAPMINPSLATSLVTARRIKCGFTRIDEKNWIPFTRGGKLHFVYEPQPQEVAVVRDDGSCEKLYSTSFTPLQKLLQEHPRWRVRGSGQAVYISQGTQRLRSPHFLALLHIFDLDTGMYAHHAYRFNPDPPFEIWQVSTELKLMTSRSDLGGARFAFASGLSVVDNSAVISYGAGDQESRAHMIPLTVLDGYFPTCYVTAGYFMGTRPMNYWRARQHCRENGAELISFESREEQEYVWTKVANMQTYWIGLNEMEQEGNWVYDDGEPLSYTDWANAGTFWAEPNNWGGDEDCACIGINNENAWYDAPCTMEAQFVCKPKAR